MKTLKILALGYLIKALLVGAAWILVPDLPQRAVALVRALTQAAAEPSQKPVPKR
jgi:hypothetical protein